MTSINEEIKNIVHFTEVTLLTYELKDVLNTIRCNINSF